MSRTALLAGLALLGCSPDPAAPLSDVAPPEGAWNVRATPISHGCPEVAVLAPVIPGPATFEVEGATLRVHDRLDTMTFQATAAGTWGAAATASHEDCRVDGAAEWTFDAVGPTLFVARYEATYDLSGAACPLTTCTVAWHVQGVR